MCLLYHLKENDKNTQNINFHFILIFRSRDISKCILNFTVGTSLPGLPGVHWSYQSSIGK